MSNVVAAMRPYEEANPLAQFLSEAEHERRAPRAERVATLEGGDAYIDPSEVTLDTLEVHAGSARNIPRAPAFTSPAEAQLWPMLAAACVALGVAIILLTTLARYELLGPQL